MSEPSAEPEVTSGVARSVVHPERRQFVANLIGAILWTAFAMLYLSSSLSGGEILDLGLMVFYLIVAYLMLARRPVRREGAWWEQALGWASAAFPLVGFRPTPGDWPLAAIMLHGVGLAAMVYALATLGRSFAIAPADRGLVTRGPYRVVRHPMYAAELLSNAGFVLANLSWRNAVAMAVMLGTIVWRIAREERIIAQYADYAARVRWRLVPGVW